MRSSLVVRASDCQCRSRNSPGFDTVESESRQRSSVEYSTQKKSLQNPPVKDDGGG